MKAVILKCCIRSRSAEAAEYARVSTDTIDDWAAQGNIRRAKLGSGRPGGVLIECESLELKHARGFIWDETSDGTGVIVTLSWTSK